MKTWIVLFLVGVLMLQPGLAQDEDSAFSDSDFDLELPADDLELDLDITTPVVRRDWEFYGFFQTDLGRSIPKEDGSPTLAKFRATLNLTFDYNLTRDWKLKLNGSGFYDFAYGINGRDKYTTETLETYEKEVEMKDTYVEGDLGSGFSLKVGRQIIAWGESDATQINDMANPRDNREIGMVELEDARIPVTSSFISWTGNDWRLDFAAIHEYRSNKIAPEGSEFDPLTTMRSTGINIAEEELPENGGEWTARIQKSLNGADIALYASDTFNDAFYLDFESLVVTHGNAQLTVRPKHQKVNSVGVSANKVLGSLLIKGEIAFKEGMMYQRSDLTSQIQAAVKSGSLTISTTQEKKQLQNMLGLEYMGFSDLTLTMELNRTLIMDWEENLTNAEDTYFSFSSVTHQAFNDTLTNRFVWIHYTDDGGDVYRWTADYDLIDGLNIAGGVVLYHSPKSDSLMEPFKNNDRLTLSSRYSF